ncbi:hypothetical protein B9T16_29350 [Arthrospira sp. PCC 8006]
MYRYDTKLRDVQTVIGMVRSAFLIFNQGVKVPTRRLFRALQPYFIPERFALYNHIYNQNP